MKNYTVLQKELHIPSDGKKLCAILTTGSLDGKTSKNPIVILLHGGPEGNKNGPEGVFSRLAQGLAQNGVDSIRFDFRGQGDSEGDYIDTTVTSQQEDFYAVYSELKNLGYDDFGVVGESFGATCLLGVYENQFKTVVMLWPAIYLLDVCFAPFFEEPYKTQLKELGHLVCGKDKIGVGLLDELEQIDNYEAKARELDVPVLIIHGDNDSEVPYKRSVETFDFLKEPKKLIIVPDGDHCLRKPHEQEIVFNETLNWILTYIK